MYLHRCGGATEVQRNTDGVCMYVYMYVDGWSDGRRKVGTYECMCVRTYNAASMDVNTYEGR